MPNPNLVSDLLFFAKELCRSYTQEEKLEIYSGLWHGTATEIRNIEAELQDKLDREEYERGKRD